MRRRGGTTRPDVEIAYISLSNPGNQPELIHPRNVYCKAPGYDSSLVTEQCNVEMMATSEFVREWRSQRFRSARAHRFQDIVLSIARLLVVLIPKFCDRYTPEA